MMLAVKTLLPRVVDCNDRPVGVIRIETTNPVFLVFARNDTQPRWVVRFAPQSRVARNEEVLRTLHAADSDLVARPLGSCRVDERNWMQVQSGLPGHPWFRLRQRINTAADWEHVRVISRTALTRLHAAVRTHEGWWKDVDIAAGLRELWEAATSLGLRSARVEQAVDEALDACHGRCVRWFAQHGDFCINNLMIEGDQARVMDFEEFGLTFMPFHDEFSLALSLDEMAPNAAAQPLTEQVAFVLDRPEIAQSGLLELARPLWLHHLLWRFATSHEIANRLSQAQRWLDVLERSVAHDHSVVSL